jgi:hypothetical protein
MLSSEKLEGGVEITAKQEDESSQRGWVSRLRKYERIASQEIEPCIRSYDDMVIIRPRLTMKLAEVCECVTLVEGAFN